MSLDDWSRYAMLFNESKENDWIRLVSAQEWNYVDRALRAMTLDHERYGLSMTFQCYVREGFRSRPWGMSPIISRCWGCVQASILCKCSLT